MKKSASEGLDYIKLVRTSLYLGWNSTVAPVLKQSKELWEIQEINLEIMLEDRVYDNLSGTYWSQINITGGDIPVSATKQMGLTNPKPFYGGASQYSFEFIGTIDFRNQSDRQYQILWL